MQLKDLFFGKDECKTYNKCCLLKQNIQRGSFDDVTAQYMP